MANFFQLLQTDPNLTLHLKTTDLVPIREKEKGTKAKAPYVLLSNFSELTLFSQDVQPAVVDRFISQLNAHVLSDQFSAKHFSLKSEVDLIEIFSISLTLQVSLMKLRTLTPLVLVQEQKK